jgi:hypothetical protein
LCGHTRQYTVSGTVLVGLSLFPLCALVCLIVLIILLRSCCLVTFPAVLPPPLTCQWRHSGDVRRQQHYPTFTPRQTAPGCVCHGGQEPLWQGPPPYWCQQVGFEGGHMSARMSTYVGSPIRTKDRHAMSTYIWSEITSFGYCKDTGSVRASLGGCFQFLHGQRVRVCFSQSATLLAHNDVGCNRRIGVFSSNVMCGGL